MILTIALVLGLTVGGLEIRRRMRKRGGAGTGGRYRSNRGPLSLDRRARPGQPGPGRSSSSSSSSAAGPIFLGLVAAVLCFWMVAAYLFPEAEIPTASLEPVADAAPPEQFHVLAGRLTGDLAQPPAPGGSIALSGRSDPDGEPAPPAALPPERGPAVTGALAMISTQSRLDQVGLQPGQTGGKPATQPQAPVRAAQAQPTAPKPPAAKPTAAAPPAARTVTAPAAGSADQVDPSSVVAATSATPGSTPPPAPAVDGPPPASPGRAFTVHLGSFSEQDNAEKYKNRLTGASELAFISERTVDGRLWFRVMSGRFASREEARAHGLDLRKRGLTADNGRFLVQAAE